MKTHCCCCNASENDVTSEDILRSQNLRLQRALLKEQRKVDNNKVVASMIGVIVLILILF